MLLLCLLVFIIVEKKGTFAIVSTSKLDFHCRSSLLVDPTRSSGWEICEIYVSWNFVRIPEVHMLGGSLNHSARDLRIGYFAVAGNFIYTTYPFSPKKQRHQYSFDFHFFLLCVSVQLNSEPIRRWYIRTINNIDVGPYPIKRKKKRNQNVAHTFSSVSVDIKSVSIVQAGRMVSVPK